MNFSFQPAGYSLQVAEYFIGNLIKLLLWLFLKILRGRLVNGLAGERVPKAKNKTKEETIRRTRNKKAKPNSLWNKMIAFTFHVHSPKQCARSHVLRGHTILHVKLIARCSDKQSARVFAKEQACYLTRST